MSAKNIILRPIDRDSANRFVRANHYSGRVVNNSQFHIGVYYGGKLEGVMQFGPPLDKRKLVGLVYGTPWNGMFELNRMAFSDALPRNSESRALSVAVRLIRKHLPHIKWFVTFADGTQCGDGTIYRAAGFILTQVKPNTQIWELPDGSTFNDTSIRPGIGGARMRRLVVYKTTMSKGKNILDTGASSMKLFRKAGAKIKDGFQLRYIAFVDSSWRHRLIAPVIPYTHIAESGAAMYKGERMADSGRARSNAREGAQIPPARSN